MYRYESLYASSTGRETIHSSFLLPYSGSDCGIDGVWVLVVVNVLTATATSRVFFGPSPFLPWASRSTSTASPYRQLQTKTKLPITSNCLRATCYLFFESSLAAQPSQVTSITGFSNKVPTRYSTLSVLASPNKLPQGQPIPWAFGFFDILASSANSPTTLPAW